MLLDTTFSVGLSGFHGSGSKEVRPSADAGTLLSRSTTFQLVVIDEELWSKDVFCGGKLKATCDTFCTNLHSKCSIASHSFKHPVFGQGKFFCRGVPKIQNHQR